MKYQNNPKAKRYFWLKLKNDFFEQKEIKLLRRIADGDTYTIIYLKMMLKSLKNDGKLFYEFYGDNFAEEIALDIDENTEDVAMTISYLESKELIELVEQDEYFLNKVPEMLGSESYSAERMRNLRRRKVSHSDEKPLQSSNNVFSSDEEKEIEKELEIESEIDKERKEKNGDDFKKIITFWEQKGFGLMNPKNYQDFKYWIQDFIKLGATEKNAINLIVHALEIAVDNNVRKYSYANAILKDWEVKLLLTVEQVKVEDKKKNIKQKINIDSELPETGEDW